MATVKEEQIVALSFCPESTCRGYGQTEAPAIRSTTSYTYGDAGSTDGLAQFTERTTSSVRFADPDADGRCDACGLDKMISEQKRPEYPPMHRPSPVELLTMRHLEDGADDRQSTRAEIQALREEINRLRSERSDQGSAVPDGAARDTSPSAQGEPHAKPSGSASRKPRTAEDS